jgi:hypothetical protein
MMLSHISEIVICPYCFNYLKPTDKSFSLQAPQVDTVYQLLSGIDESKSEGLDNIPNKLLKIATTVIAPSLTGIFAASIRTGIFP